MFDLDGTLVDSLRDLAESANALIVEAGGCRLPEESIGRMVGDGAAALVRRAFRAASLEPPSDALERFLAIYDSRLLTFTRPYAGVDETLSALAPRARLAVLTNKPIDATRRILTGLDLARYFPPDRVIGGDGPFSRKPDPAGLIHLVTAECVTVDETLLVGDSVIDWRTARAACCHVCLARYGFGYEGFPVADLDRADRLIDQPLDLLTIL